jgi:hypothetical protein
MAKSRKEIVADYCKEIRSGKIAYSALREILESRNFSDDDIKIILYRVDRDLQRLEAIDSERAQGKQMFFSGIVVVILGILLTITTYMGIIDLGDRFIVSYGPVIGGLGVTLIGKLKMDRLK